MDNYTWVRAQTRSSVTSTGCTVIATLHIEACQKIFDMGTHEITLSIFYLPCILSYVSLTKYIEEYQHL
jgi:multisubunit Na+/H+ antiporter MnhG subunit